MPRPKKGVSMAEQIQVQEALVAQIKKQYELELECLRELIQKDSTEKREKLLYALENSSKSYDEILEFLNDGVGGKKT